MSEIATFATYMAVCHVPVLRNCFLIVPCLVLHEDVENAIFLALSHFFFYICSLNYSEIGIPHVRSQIELFGRSLFDSNLKLKYLHTRNKWFVAHISMATKFEIIQSSSDLPRSISNMQYKE